MFSRRAKPQGIIVVVEKEEQLQTLLARGYRLASVRGENLRILVLSDTDKPPDWLRIPKQFDPQRITAQPVSPERAGRQIAKYVSEHPPVLARLSGFALRFCEFTRCTRRK